MTVPNKTPLPPTAIQYFNDKGRFDFSLYLQSIDQLLAALASANVATLVNASNDTQAKQRGVAVGQFYRNGSAVMVRVT